METPGAKRIAIVVSTFPPYRGGMGNVAAEHAAVLSSAGHDVSVFTPAAGFKPRAADRTSDVKCHTLRPWAHYGNAAVLPQLAWRLRGFDIVELHYPFFGGAEYVLLWKRLFGRKSELVLMYHMDVVGKGLHRSVFRLYRRLFLAPLMRAADRIIATSRDYLAHSSVRAYADDPRVRVVPLSVDTERFLPALIRKRETAIFVGGLDSAHYFKGVEVLLEAFRRVVKEVPHARLLVVGDGDLRAGYERKAAEIGIVDFVRFAGRLTDGELPEAYREAAMVVLPSLDGSEAFGLVLLEGGASGLPAVVSDLPGVRSVVPEGETGLHVPPGQAEPLADAMLDLYRDPEKADRMGRAARERAERVYAAETVRDSLIEAIID